MGRSQPLLRAGSAQPPSTRFNYHDDPTREGCCSLFSREWHIMTRRGHQGWTQVCPIWWGAVGHHVTCLHI